MAKPDNRITVTFEDGRFSFLAKEGRLGWKALAPCVLTDQGEECLTHETVRRKAHRLTVAGRYAQSALAETLLCERRAKGGLVVTRRLRNPGPRAICVREAFMGRAGGDGGPVFADNSGWRLRFAHLDNLRTEEFPRCRPEYPYVRMAPQTPAWFGDKESQAAPYLLLCNDDYSEMLVTGQLAQERTRMRWRLAAAPAGMWLLDEYRISWDPFNGRGFTLQPGETLEMEPLFFQILTDSHPQTALTGYFAATIERNRFPQEDNILHSKAFYCSWNYGIMESFTGESLLKTARFIKAKLPGIRHFLVDGGWQAPEAVKGPSLASLYLPEGQRHDPRKLPQGMKGLADRIREIGLAPAIWWPAAVGLDSRLARENPHWLAGDQSGVPYRIMNAGYLDYSLPEVQRFLHRVFRTLFKEWGFEAIKMDFWSQSVESSRIRYAAGTGIQWRDWLLSTIRSYLPRDGFLMTCVATAMGNPFLGKHAHTYRACIDVGDCRHWREHVYASCWLQGMLAFPGRRTCLLNADGFGVSARFSDAENLHRLTYGFITMGSIEIDGRLEDLSPRHLDWLRRLTAHIDRGYPCLTADEQAFTGAPYPRVLFVDYPAGSPTRRRGVRKHVALLNWSAEPQYIGVANAKLGLKGRTLTRDFWTDARKTFGADGIHERIEPHGARLYEIAD